MDELRSSRLVLGANVPENFEALHRWKTDREVLEMSDDDAEPATEEQTRATLARWMQPHREIIHWAVYLLPERRPIGFVQTALIDTKNQRCRLGLVIGEKSLWGQGYGSEALSLVVEHCFTVLQLNRIGAEAYANNPRSVRMLERAGFVREGVLRESVYKSGVFVDEIVFGLLRRDWEASRR